MILGVSTACFQTNVLTKFVDTICIFFYTHSLISYVIALNNGVAKWGGPGGTIGYAAVGYKPAKAVQY